MVIVAGQMLIEGFVDVTRYALSEKDGCHGEECEVGKYSCGQPREYNSRRQER